MSQHAAEFMDRFFQLFFSSFLTNIAVGVLCGLIGLFIVLRRMIFVSAALSQVAGAGLAMAFFIGAVLAPHEGAPPPPVRIDEQMDVGPVEKDTEEIRDILEEEFPDIGVEDEDEDEDKEENKALPGGTKGDARNDDTSLKQKNPNADKREKQKTSVASNINQESKRALSGSSRENKQKKSKAHLVEIPAAFLAILVTILVSLLLAKRATTTKQEQTKEETVVGVLFILGSALALVFAVKADKAAHEIQDVLFGVAVLVPKEQQQLVAIMGIIVLAAYILMFKDFTFVSFDPTAAIVSGFPIGWANAVLFILIAVVIAVCTRAVGAMPVFALTVLPATAALLLHDRIVPAAFTAAVLGGVSAGAGYFITGLWELPVGPCIALAATVPLIGAAFYRRCCRWAMTKKDRKSAAAVHGSAK